MSKKSQEDRDLAELKKRRAKSEGVSFVEEEITRPVDLAQLSPERYSNDQRFRQELQAAIERYEQDPAYRAMWNIFRRQKRESEQTAKNIGNAALEAASAAAHSPSQELLNRVDKAEEMLHRIDTMLKIAKWILGIVLSVAVGALLTIAYKIYDEGYEKGALVNRVDQLEKTIEHLKGTKP